MAQQMFWMVYSIKNEGRLEKFDNYEDAADEAKRKAAHGDTYVLVPIGYVKQPVPDLPVEKISR